MNKKTELKLLDKIEKLEQEVATLKYSQVEKPKGLPSYQYSKISFNQLENLVDIRQKITKYQFDQWFNANINIESTVISFLENLIEREKHYIKIYNEEDLKVNFIIPVLNKVNFKISDNIRSFYEERITYTTDSFIFNGTTDFLVSKGFRKPQKPYFFIQEFKKGQSNAFPEPQLLAELIAAVELNDWKSIRGAYIVGAIWNFVILEKLKTGKYQYFVSENFDCTKINDLKNIFKHLTFVKHEIINSISK
jgi:hypothetical protein